MRADSGADRPCTRNAAMLGMCCPPWAPTLPLIGGATARPAGSSWMKLHKFAMCVEGEWLGGRQIGWSWRSAPPTQSPGGERGCSLSGGDAAIRWDPVKHRAAEPPPYGCSAALMSFNPSALAHSAGPDSEAISQPLG